MPKQTLISNLVAAIAATIAAAFGAYALYHLLGGIDNMQDGFLILFSSITVFIVAYVVAWGHFQDPDFKAPSPREK